MSIIICPNCQKEVSSLAPLCPHCGIKISDNIANCPECGKPYLIDTTSTCSHCGIVLNSPANNNGNPGDVTPFAQTPEAMTEPQPVATTTPVKSEAKPIVKPVATEPVPNVTTPPTSPKIEESTDTQCETAESKPTKKKGWGKACLFGCLGAVIIAAIAIAIGVFVVVNNLNEEKEKKAYAELKEDFTIRKAERFLDEYPDSKYKIGINDEINRLKRCDEEWNKIANSNRPEDFIHFREQFPSSQYESIIDEKLGNSSNALNGNSLTSAEKSKVEDVMFRFLAALSDDNKDMLREVCNPEVYKKSCSFVGNKNNTQIVTYDFSSPVSIEKTAESDDKLYNVNTTAIRSIEDESGNTTKKALTIKATVNVAMKITSISMALSE